MKFGIARDIITPNVKTYMTGYGQFYGRFFEGIHDDLFVRTLIMDDGRRKIVLIAVDLLFHSSTLTKEIKRYITKNYGLNENNVLIAYTHTHLGLAVDGCNYGQCVDAYDRFLEQRIKSCIDRAFVNLFDGRISLAAIDGDWNINRRKTVNGRIELRPNPQAATDKCVDVLRICDLEGRTRIWMLTYACHPVTLGDTPMVSAEYPGRLCQLLESLHFGSVSLFFQGAGADAHPKSTAKGDDFVRGTFDDVDKMATAMVSRIQEAVSAGLFEPFELNLDARQFTIPLEVEPWPKSVLEEIAADKSGSSFPDLRDLDGHFVPTVRYEAKEILRQYDQMENQVRLPAGIFRLNEDVYIPFMGGEPCYGVKRVLEKTFDGKKIIFIGYGDSSSYIPTDRILAEGGYEAEGSTVEFQLKGPYKQGIDDRIREAFRIQLQSLRS